MFNVQFLKDSRNNRVYKDLPLPPQTKLSSSQIWNKNGFIKRSPRLAIDSQIPSH